MRLPFILASIMLMVLTSCSAPRQDNVQAIPYNALQPQPGMAKFIVYYPYSRIWSGKTVDMTIDGEQDCRLTSGNFFLRDVSPGKVEISASLCNGNGVTRLNVNAVPGREYYVQVIPKDQSLLGLIASYGTHTTKGKLTHAEGTAFYIDLMDEQTANAQLGRLKMIK